MSSRQAGFSLLELLLGCLLATLVVVASIELLRVHVAVARRLQARLASTGGAAWALAIAARDVELAGGDPTRAGIAALAAARSDRLVLERDEDADGAAAADTAERVTLAWSPSAGGRFVRWLGGQSTSIASAVRSGGFRLRYFDAVGAEIAPGGGDLAASELDRVRRVALELDVVDRAGTVSAETSLRGAAALRLRMEGR